MFIMLCLIRLCRGCCVCYLDDVLLMALCLMLINGFVFDDVVLMVMYLMMLC